VPAPASPLSTIGRAVRAAARRLSVPVLVLACAGCGATTSATPKTPKTPKTKATTTKAVASAPSTTPSATTTTTTTTTPTGAALPGSGRPPIVVGDKNYTEQFLLGQLYVQALTGQGFTVTVDQNIGVTQVTMQALKDGSLSMYPEYLNVFDSAAADDLTSYSSEGAALSAARSWAGPHGLSLLSPTPFSDTGGLAVTDAYAAINRLGSIGDLRRVATALTIGGPSQFQTGSPGLPELDAAYGLAPAAFKAMAVGDQYSALADDTVQAADINTTDGELGTGDYTVLRDPRHVFGWGNVVPVVSTKVLLAEGPAFRNTINQVDATLTPDAMRQLNAAVDVAQQDPTVVAKQFLETHGLLAPLAP
jgi:osmoprotectant transport system substrate-binding protein